MLTLVMCLFPLFPIDIFTWHTELWMNPTLIDARICTHLCVCACVLVTQSCPTLCDPMDCSPLGFSVHGILQARILGWTTIPLSVHIYRKHKFWLMQATHLQTLEDVTFAEQTISNRSFDVQWSSLVWWSICLRRKQRDCKPNIHRSYCGWSWDCTSGIWRGGMVVWGLPRRC